MKLQMPQNQPFSNDNSTAKECGQQTADSSEIAVQKKFTGQKYIFRFADNEYMESDCPLLSYDYKDHYCQFDPMTSLSLEPGHPLYSYCFYQCPDEHFSIFASLHTRPKHSTRKSGIFRFFKDIFERG